MANVNKNCFKHNTVIFFSDLYIKIITLLFSGYDLN